MVDQPQRACSIEQVGKQRNGRPRFWCSTHQASATGRYGIRLEACEGAYRDYEFADVFDFEPDVYPGGIALWGAVTPVYNTSRLPVEAGIHVHARMTPGGSKVIDRTYEAVRVRDRQTLFSDIETIITRDTAVNYYISRYLGHDTRPLFCIHCGEVHLDADYFAVKPHKKHLCHACGKNFHDKKRGISNPIAILHRPPFASNISSRETVRSEMTLDIAQCDFPGGIQVWASNPALIWTASGPEKAGLHIHTFDANDQYVHDETYGSVYLDGEQLSEAHIGHYMAQTSLKYLGNKVACLCCPVCNQPHFDAGELGFFPHIEHSCEHCGTLFHSPRRRRCVSNPFVETRNRLTEMRMATLKKEGR